MTCECYPDWSQVLRRKLNPSIEISKVMPSLILGSVILELSFLIALNTWNQHACLFSFAFQGRSTLCLSLKRCEYRPHQFYIEYFTLWKANTMATELISSVLGDIYFILWVRIFLMKNWNPVLSHPTTVPVHSNMSQVAFTVMELCCQGSCILCSAKWH